MKNCVPSWHDIRRVAAMGLIAAIASASATMPANAASKPPGNPTTIVLPTGTVPPPPGPAVVTNTNQSDSHPGTNNGNGQGPTKPNPSNPEPFGPPGPECDNTHGKAPQNNPHCNPSPS